MKLALIAAVATALVLGADALAAPPALVTVGHVDGHPTATWALPAGVQARVIEIATTPAAGSDGYFFSENRKEFETLEEAQTTWTSSDRLAPGTYYVHVAGLDWPCFMANACSIREFSNVLTLTIPNVVPRISISGLSVSGVYTKMARLRLRVCDRERGELRVTVTERRFRGRKTLATARHTHRIYLSADCETETVWWTISKRLVRKGDSYSVQAQVRDANGARSNAATKVGRWR